MKTNILIIILLLCTIFLFTACSTSPGKDTDTSGRIKDETTKAISSDDGSGDESGEDAAAGLLDSSSEEEKGGMDREDDSIKKDKTTKEKDTSKTSEPDTKMIEEDKGRGKETIPDSSGLRAGYADDNKQFNYFISFLDTYKGVEHHPIEINERVMFKVLDSNGKSIPNADVTVYGKGKTLCRGLTYADGAFLFFPAEFDGNNNNSDYYDIEVAYRNRTKTYKLMRDGKRSVDIVFDDPRPVMTNVPLDILFILDTTGSMGEEIKRLKTTIEIINMNIASLSSKPKVRFGMVLYRDRVDEEYITEIIPLTGDLDEFQSRLDKVEADGGGDIREDLQSALADAMKKIKWNKDGIRMSFIITDAPPHLDYAQDYNYVDAVHDSRQKGIKIFSVGTGGLQVDGEYILRQISQYTYAKYIFLTYGEKGESEGGSAGSVSHHTGANFQTDKLETIIIRFAKEELSFLTDQKLEEGDEYFEAVKIKEEEKEITLKKLFTMAVVQLSDYSSIGLKKGTRASVIPIVSADAAYKLDGEYFTDQINTSITARGFFTMVERENLQKILEELELQLSGIVSDENAVKVGEMLGAEVLITGKLYRKEKEYEIFFKLLRVETGEVLSVTKTRIDAALGLSK